MLARPVSHASVKHKSHVHGFEQRDPCVLTACATQENLLCTSSNMIAWLNCLKSISPQPLRQTLSGNNAPREEPTTQFSLLVGSPVLHGTPWGSFGKLAHSGVRILHRSAGSLCAGPLLPLRDSDPPDTPPPDTPPADRLPLDCPPPDCQKISRFFSLVPPPFSFFFSLSGDVLVSSSLSGVFSWLKPFLLKPLFTRRGKCFSRFDFLCVPVGQGVMPHRGWTAMEVPSGWYEVIRGLRPPSVRWPQAHLQPPFGQQSARRGKVNFQEGRRGRWRNPTRRPAEVSHAARAGSMCEGEAVAECHRCVGREGVWFSPPPFCVWFSPPPFCVWVLPSTLLCLVFSTLLCLVFRCVSSRLVIHHPAWVGHHTGGSRSTPTVHPCRSYARLWVTHAPTTSATQCLTPRSQANMVSERWTW